MSTKIFQSSPGQTLALILAIFVLRALLAITVVPPWQNPDEPQHFEFVHILAQQEQLDLSERRDLDLERNLLRSMSAHGWWRHYAEPEPSPLPVDFLEVPEHLFPVLTSPPMYYLLGAAGLKLTRPDDLLTQYYILRGLALVLAVPTIVCIWAGTRRLFGTRVAAGATLLTALHPQFVLMSTAVNPDVLVNLCGAVVWWQGARLLTGSSGTVSMAAMACATVVALLTKRLAAPIVLMLGVVPLVAVRFGRPGGWRSIGPSLGIVVAGMMLGGLAAAVWFGDEVIRLRDYWGYLLTFSLSDRAQDWTFFLRFTEGLFNSAWLMAGWLRYPAPPAWLLTVQLLTAGAVAGCLIGARRPEMVKWRSGFALAGVLIVIQTAGIYGGLYMNGLSAQGRYLFPVIGPFMALFWVGVHSWWPQRLWPLVGAVLVVLMFTFDVIGWSTVIMPAYLQ